MKFTVNIVIRLVLYAWLAIWVLFRIKMQPAYFDYILLGAIILMSVLLSFYPYDKNLLKIIVKSKKYMFAFFIVLGVIWIQVLYEWLSLVPKHTSNSGSYLHYIPILAVMGLPSSIITIGFSFIFDPDTLIHSEWLLKTYIWFTYFILAFVQFYLIYRWLRKKWGDTEIL